MSACACREWVPCAPRTGMPIDFATPLRLRRQHAAADLVLLQRLEQGLEVPLAEALVALALDDLEEDGTNQVLSENLQQKPLALARRAVDEDAVGAQPRNVFAMSAHTRIDLIEIGVRRFLEAHAAGAHRLNGGEDVVCGQRHVLDALAMIVAQELLDLRLVVLALVQRDSDLAAGAGHRLGEQACVRALDVEVTDLFEIEDALVELGPMRHAA